MIYACCQFGFLGWVNMRIFGALIFTLLAMTSGVCARSQFVKIEVGETVVLDVPRHWVIQDPNQMKNVAAAVESLTGETVPVTSLSVHATPSPTGALIRVTLDDADPPIYQFQVAAATLAEKAEFERDIAAEFSSQVKATAAKAGFKIISQPSATVRQLNGYWAFEIVYRRTGTNNSIFEVTQYHIPAGKRDIIFTISYRVQNANLYRPILEHVASSLRIVPSALQ